MSSIKRFFSAAKQGILTNLKDVLLALGAGLSMVLAFAPFEQWWLSFLSLGLLYVLIRDKSLLKAGLIGWIYGLGVFLSGISWIGKSLAENGLGYGIASVAIFILCMALAAYIALACGIFRFFKTRWVLSPFLFAALWTLMEWLRGTLFTGFPWLNVGYVHAGLNSLQGFASLVGVYGLSFLTVLMAAWGVELLFAGMKKQWKVVGAIASLFFGVFILGAIHHRIPYTQPLPEIVPTSLIQGNIPMDLKWDPQASRYSQYFYWNLTLQSRGKLIIWPETGIPRYLDQVEVSFLETVVNHLVENEMALISGVSIREPDFRTNPDYLSYNSLVGLGTKEPVVQFYYKFHLVPFGEYIPKTFRWLVDAFLPMSDFTSGTEVPNSPRIMEFLGLKIAPTICYEDAFGEEILPGARQAAVLINISNLAWFGDYLALEQHFQMSRMRALEVRKPMLSVTNTGTTGAISPDGTIIGKLPRGEVGILEIDLQGYEGQTPYQRFGDRSILIFSGLLIILAFFWKQRKIDSRVTS